MIRFFSKTSFWALLAISFLATSCDNDDDSDDMNPDPGPTQNIAEIASANAEFSILVEALTAANLVDAVSDESATLTVFAPTNTAFNQLFDDLGLNDDNADGSRVDELVATLGAETTTEILLYHVLGDEIRSADVPAKAYVTTSSTASPNNNQLSLLVENRSNGVFLNNSSQVSMADILATNGVIHAINSVLLLPNVVDHAINNPGDLSELTNAVVAAGLDGTLADASAEYTVFAPVNAAFEAISSTVAGLTTEQLTTVLTYHVLSTEVRAEDINPGSVQTVSTQSIGISVSSEGVVTISDVDESNSDATVVLTNVQGTNGVVHVINGVLIPAL